MSPNLTLRASKQLPLTSVSHRRSNWCLHYLVVASLGSYVLILLLLASPTQTRSLVNTTNFFTDSQNLSIFIDSIRQTQCYLTMYSVLSAPYSLRAKHKIFGFDVAPVKFSIRKYVLLGDIRFIVGLNEVYEIITSCWRTLAVFNIFVIVWTSASHNLHILVGSMGALQNYCRRTTNTTELRESSQVTLSFSAVVCILRYCYHSGRLNPKEQVLWFYQSKSLVCWRLAYDCHAYNNCFWYYTWRIYPAPLIICLYKNYFPLFQGNLSQKVHYFWRKQKRVFFTLIYFHHFKHILKLLIK